MKPRRAMRMRKNPTLATQLQCILDLAADALFHLKHTKVDDPNIELRLKQIRDVAKRAFGNAADIRERIGQ